MSTTTTTISQNFGKAKPEERRSSDSDASDACTTVAPVRSTVGLVLTSSIVQAVIEGGPAEKCGLIGAGDEIVWVDGIPVSQLNAPLASRLRGEVGTGLDLKIRKCGTKKIVDVHLVRQPFVSNFSNPSKVVALTEKLRNGIEEIISNGSCKEGSGIEEIHDVSVSLANEVSEMSEYLRMWRGHAEAAYERCSMMSSQIDILRAELELKGPHGTTTPSLQQQQQQQSSSIADFLNVFAPKPDASLLEQVSMMQQEVRMLQTERDRMLLEIQSAHADAEREKTEKEGVLVELADLKAVHATVLEESMREIEELKQTLDNKQQEHTQVKANLAAEMRRLEIELDASREAHSCHMQELDELARTSYAQAQQLETVQKSLSDTHEELVVTRQQEEEKRKAIEQLENEICNKNGFIGDIQRNNEKVTCKLEEELKCLQQQRTQESQSYDEMAAALNAKIELLTKQLEESKERAGSFLSRESSLSDESQEALDRIISRCKSMLQSKQNMMTC